MTDTRTFTVLRDGDRDLTFEGVMLGEGRCGVGNSEQWTRGTDVSILKTTAGRYVVEVCQWDTSGDRRESNRAGVLNSASDVLQWLRDDCGNKLGPASKAALQAAAKNDEGLATLVDETVE